QMRLCLQRREFVAGLGGAAAWPLAARAQQGEQVRRIGILAFGTETDSLVVRVIYEELQKLGWIEGRNLRLDHRFAPSDLNRLRAEAAELVRLAPDVIFGAGGAAFEAVQKETRMIPIVFLVGDPAALGQVKNIARPEGNATGFASAFGSLGGKWLELLKGA